MNDCPFCGKPIAEGERVYREMTGWAETRRAGGTNAIALRKETGRVAHWYCIDRAKRGLTGQQSLI